MVSIIGEGEVVYGIQLPIQSQSALYAADWEVTAGPKELGQIARVADETGFFYLGVCDHSAIPKALAPTMRTTWYDTTATLGWLAGITSQIKLLSHVYVLALRHPLRAAKEFATLDALSGGRLIIGVGAGHLEEEYKLFGGTFANRGADTDEAIRALSSALCEEYPSFKGFRWSFSDLGISPRPVQSPRPPIWIGGSSEPARRRAGHLGDGWLPQGTRRRDLPAQIQSILNYREEAGIKEPIAIGTIAEPIYLSGTGTPGDPSFDLPKFVLKGGPDYVAASLRELVSMGVSHLQLRFMARSVSESCEQMAAFASMVGPHLGK